MAGQKKQTPHKKNEPNFPGLDEHKSPKATLQYDIIQQEEIMVLSSIYGADLEFESKSTAWKKSEPSFEIRIKASSDPDLAVTLKVVLLATYPKQPPLLAVNKFFPNVLDSTKFKIETYLKSEPEILARDEAAFMHQIIEGIREILEDAAQLKIQGLELPSLEQERAAHTAKLARIAEEEKELQNRRKHEESEESQRVLQGQIQAEEKRNKVRADEYRIKAKGQHTRQDRSTDEPTDVGETCHFDTICKCMIQSGELLEFQRVTSKVVYSQGPVATTYTVMPLPLGSAGFRPILLALKQADLKSKGKESVQFRKHVDFLDDCLQSLLTKPRHRNILGLIGYRIDRGSRDILSPNALWKLSVLSPLAERGSLDEFLGTAGTLEPVKVKSWTVGLLDGLSFLHTNGFVHADLHTTNILLCKEATGNIIPMIADTAYQRVIHDICAEVNVIASTRGARSVYWLPPEIASATKPQYTHKTDMWDFGIVFLQMIFGLDVMNMFPGPRQLLSGLSLSESLQELVSQVFNPEPRKRPRAFDSMSSEFLSTGASVFSEGKAAIPLPPNLPHGLRRESAYRGSVQPHSRFLQDYEDAVLLGKGGFGEVVRVRGRVDKAFYAIKTVRKSSGTLSTILNEVLLLARLSHPSVVKYYGAWLEEASETPMAGGGHDDDDDDDSSSADSECSNSAMTFQNERSRGLDFISNSGHAGFVFGEDSDHDESELSSDGETEPATDDQPNHDDQMASAATRTRRPKILFIAMEYCDKSNLRDLISRGLWRDSNETWRLFRQILEGLAHIHNFHVIHRDLKPENIFITVDSDGMNNVKIGDFGLATSGQVATEMAQITVDPVELTRSIGTAVYTAPEVRSKGKGTYTTKVDMYSSGIIFFEMSHPLSSGMERAISLEALRQAPPKLPDKFEPFDDNHKDIILSLVDHDPERRPSSSQLLSSGRIPDQMESESFRRMLERLKDPNSPFFQNFLENLFDHPNEPAKDYTWDQQDHAHSVSPDSKGRAMSLDPMRKYVVKDELTAIFRTHGAVETERPDIYPRSPYYGEDVFDLLDRKGMTVQLPYDLMMSNARQISRASSLPTCRRLYTFGNVFRNQGLGGLPRVMQEVDFDIVTTDAVDLALKEAETIKVLDEIITSFPALGSANKSFFQLGHSDLLQLIFEYCRVDVRRRTVAAEILSKLASSGFDWIRARTTLRTAGLSVTSIDELKKFDFREPPKVAFSKLKDLFEGSDAFKKASPYLAHLRDVYEYAVLFGVKTKIFINPVQLIKEAFFKGALAYSCVSGGKSQAVFAAGGRYDSLIKDHLPPGDRRSEQRHAVGFSLNWEILAYAGSKASGKAQKNVDEANQGIFSTKRCDVLVASFDPSVLRSVGLEILQTLWGHKISAELAGDARSPEDLLSRYRDEGHSWIVTIKQDSMLKIKTMGRKDTLDVDMPVKDLLNWLKGEIRERDTSRAVATTRMRGTAVHHQLFEGGGGGGGDADWAQQEVRVHISQTKSKKVNRQNVVEQVQVTARRIATGFLEGPIVAIETTDAVMDMIQSTRLSDAESWRKVEQTVGGAEKKYIQEVRETLEGWREEWQAKKRSRHAFVCDFRSGHGYYYDVGA